MSSNNEILQKADMAISDLASGGVLEDEQSMAFIRKLNAQPTLLRQARTVVMSSPARQINKIGFGSRILHTATSGTALSSGNRSKPDFSQVRLVTNEKKAEVRIPYDAFEDNIEGGALNLAGPNSSHKPVQGGMKSTIVTMMAERVALDLEEVALLGDTNSGDTDLAVADGYMALISSNTVNVNNAAISRAVFKNGMKGMPDQYLRNRAALRHFVSQDNEIEYRETIAQRETGAGDSAVTSNPPVYAYGVPVEPVSLMPGTGGIFTHPNNLIFGIQRQISIETDKDISAGVFIIVLTVRCAFQIEEETACVLYSNIAGT